MTKTIAKRDQKILAISHYPELGDPVYTLKGSRRTYSKRTATECGEYARQI